VIDAISSGDPLVVGALVGVGLLLVAWFIAIVAAGDVEEGTEDVFSVMSGILLGLASIGVILIGGLAGLVAEAPGIVTTAIAGVVGYASIAGIVDLAAPVFVLLVVGSIVGAIALREA
jgi:hypothetical protein